jgi:cytochrome c556
MLTRIVLAGAIAALGVTAVLAQSDPIAARKALMKANSENGRNVTKMIRGEEPFDAAKADKAFAQWAETAAKLPDLFPDSSKSGDTRALPVIWEKRSEFLAAVSKFAKDVADSREKAKTLDGLKAVMPSVSKNCNDCHDAFRKKAT